jgi:PTH2 family peptidyl-tRNA hydrolase
MGFDEQLVAIAAAQCPAGSIEDIVSCILLLSGDAEADAGVPAAAAAPAAEGLKMVLIVRQDLGMSPGKVAAQCVHAALGGVRESDRRVVADWEQSGEPVICLKCGSLAEMNELRAAAGRANLCTHVVHDAGRTEVPGGSQTVLCIGPSSISRIDAVTRHLKLF